MPRYVVTIDPHTSNAEYLKCEEFGGEYDEELDARVWDDGVQANRARSSFAKRFLLVNYAVKRLEDVNDENWQERETTRLADGTYIPVPWAAEAFALNGPALFAHMSRKQRGKVSYTENEDKGRADLQAPAMSPGRFLNKFYGDLLTEQEISRWAEKCGYGSDVEITQDADMIRNVYENGPDSCMSAEARRYATPRGVHPAEVYAGPDLGLAFIPNPDNANRFVARCVVWPEKKTYGRVYPHCGADRQRMLDYFEAEGWKNCPPDGARVRKIKASHGFVMPYVDDVGGA